MLILASSHPRTLRKGPDGTRWANLVVPLSGNHRTSWIEPRIFNGPSGIRSHNERVKKIAEVRSGWLPGMSLCEAKEGCSAIAEVTIALWLL